MKTMPSFLILLASLAMPHLKAEEPWLLRLRVISIQPSNKSCAIPSLGVPTDAIHVSNKVTPEFDVSYFFTPNLSSELILALPLEHDVTLSGKKIGTFKHLPPTLTAQWNFLPGQTINPYLGAGFNLTLISNVNISVPGVGALDLNKHSIGVALQAGADFKVGANWYLNFDIKYVQIRSDVKLASTGTKVSAVKIDPLILGLGIGSRF